MNKVVSTMEGIDAARKRGLKKEQLEEYACCEKLKAVLEVSLSSLMLDCVYSMCTAQQSAEGAAGGVRMLQEAEDRSGGWS